MKRSSSRILTTHVGSLIRPQPLQEFLRARQGGKSYDEKAYQTCLTESVGDVVREQAQAGIDVVSDGEFGKSISWAQYALERLSGFERRPIRQEAANPFKRGADRTRFSEFYAELDAKEAVSTTTEAICVGPIKYTGQSRARPDSRGSAARAGVHPRPPPASIWGRAARTSAARSETNSSTTSGRAATSASGAMIGMSVPGMRRPCLSGEASATAVSRLASSPATRSRATARDAAQ